MTIPYYIHSTVQGKIKIPYTEIKWLNADGRYTYISTINKKYYSSRNIGDIWCEISQSDCFYFLNRSTVINCDCVFKYLKSIRVVLTKCGQLHRVARRREEGLISYIGERNVLHNAQLVLAAR